VNSIRLEVSQLQKTQKFFDVLCFNDTSVDAILGSKLVLPPVERNSRD